MKRHRSALELVRQQLELCKLRPEERVVILTERDVPSRHLNNCFQAAAELAGEVLHLRIDRGSLAPFDSTRTGAGPGFRSLGSSSLAVEAMKAADLVIDLTTEGFFHHPVIGDVLGSGTRIIFISEPIEVLERNMTTVEDKARVLEARDVLASGTRLVVTSDAGTNLVADLTESHPGFQCGFADDPGRWDNWPSAMVTCWPRTSEGRIVLQPGDVILPFKDHLRSVIELRIEDGIIISIEGGPEAKLLDTFFEDVHDEDARHLSHLGWGLLRTADWFSLAVHDKENLMGQEARSYGGNFLFSTGPDPFAGRTTPHHLDIPMRHCTVEVDGLRVIDEGRLSDIRWSSDSAPTSNDRTSAPEWTTK